MSTHLHGGAQTVGHTLPYVFVLDWDGTIAGKVDFQSQQYGIYQALKQHGFKPAKMPVAPPAFSPNAKLIRPGFSSWMKAMQKVYPEAYFFIYTASEKQWAMQEIGWVERSHGIKFARPIFTRDDCTVDSSGNMRKSVGRIFPRMMTAIAKMSGRSKGLHVTQRQAILETQLMIIDNNAVYTDRQDKLLLCPDYGYAVFENLLTTIPHEARAHPSIQQLIMALINSGYLCTLPSEADDGMRALAKQYGWLAAKCKSITITNESYINDAFWKNLKKMIVSNQVKTFSTSIIRQLQEGSWKHAQAKR